MSHLRQQFDADIDGNGQVLSMSGDLIGKDLAFTSNRQTVATVSTRWTLGGGSYGVESSDAADAVLMQAMVVAVEMINTHRN